MLLEHPGLHIANSILSTCTMAKALSTRLFKQQISFAGTTLLTPDTKFPLFGDGVSCVENAQENTLLISRETLKMLLSLGNGLHFSFQLRTAELVLRICR